MFEHHPYGRASFAVRKRRDDLRIGGEPNLLEHSTAGEIVRTSSGHHARRSEMREREPARRDCGFRHDALAASSRFDPEADLHFAIADF